MMNILDKKLIMPLCLIVIVACNNQPNLIQKKKQDVEAVQTTTSPHFECHSSEYKFNTLGELPQPPSAATVLSISAVQEFDAPFRNVHRLPIPMNKALIVPKLQELGFREDDNDEVKTEKGKNLYTYEVLGHEDSALYISLKDFIEPYCAYRTEVHLNESGRTINGVEILIGNDGLILKDTTIPDLVISTIDHKHKPENLFKDLLDKHIQNIEAFKQKQPLNEELISTRTVYDGITYEINSFGGGRRTILQIYRHKDRKKSH